MTSISSTITTSVSCHSSEVAMRVPFNWLKEFTPVSAAASDVADSLTMRGLEVEAVEQTIPRFSGVYVGRVLEVETIRLAKKLSLCRVEVGTDVLPIVC